MSNNVNGGRFETKDSHAKTKRKASSTNFSGSLKPLSKQAKKVSFPAVRPQCRVIEILDKEESDENGQNYKTNGKHCNQNGTTTNAKKKSLSHDNTEMLLGLVRECYKQVYKSRHVEWKKKFKSALFESRDRVLQRAKLKRKQKKSGSRVIQRLPSNSCKTISPFDLCLPCEKVDSNENNISMNSFEKNNGSGKSSQNPDLNEAQTPATFPFSSNGTRSNLKNKDEGITIKIRKKNGSTYSQSLHPKLFIEGTHKPRPPHTATVFLRSHFFTEDEQDLTYVPYFGDDDKEDVVSDVFDINKREEMLKKGPEYQTSYINDMIDETIQLLRMKTKQKIVDNFDDDESIYFEIYKDLATLMNIDVQRIYERHRTCFPIEPKSSKNNATLMKKTRYFEETVKEEKKEKEEKEENEGDMPKNSATKRELKYEELMDSYRNLFCRRCFTYDCNFHGNLVKPNIELQGELAVQKELDGHWEKIEKLSANRFVCPVVTPTKPQIQTPDNAKEKNTAKAGDSNANKALEGKTSLNDGSETPSELTAFQKSICERAFLIFQGDTRKIAKVIDARHDLVEKFVAQKSYKLQSPKHVEKQKKLKSKKSKGDPRSMRNYNQTWLKRCQVAEIHPAFQPCNHDGPCSELNCSCVLNANFCTKHCVWGSKSKNFFRGCNCKGGCRTNSCPCFAANRECDPDVCHSCGACCDPPNAPAVKQLCRNDNIGMRRHCHLLLGESGIENAGWGIYTKNALKKGDYVHEYIGEVISQEEAERRGRVYDKVNRSYLFNLNSDLVVDASRKGNKTKFANHSSKPNCCTKMLNVNGDIRIGLFALEDIEPQTELFFDYRYNVGMDNDLILKPGKTVDWMENPEMANKIRVKTA